MLITHRCYPHVLTTDSMFCLLLVVLCSSSSSVDALAMSRRKSARPPSPSPSDYRATASPRTCNAPAALPTTRAGTQTLLLLLFPMLCLQRVVVNESRLHPPISFLFSCRVPLDSMTDSPTSAFNCDRNSKAKQTRQSKQGDKSSKQQETAGKKKGVSSATVCSPTSKAKQSSSAHNKAKSNQQGTQKHPNSIASHPHTPFINQVRLKCMLQQRIKGLQ